MDKANSFVGTHTPRAHSEKYPGAIAVVDPFSTGAVLAASISAAGYQCVRILSVWDSPIANMVLDELKKLEFCATIQHDDRTTDQDAATYEVRWPTNVDSSVTH